MDTPILKVRDVRKADWFSADNLVLDVYAKHFGAIGIAVYFVLCRRADAQQKCFPSQENIAEMLGISDRTVRSCLKCLEQARLIFIQRDYRNRTGEWLHNVYWLLDKSVWKLPEEMVSDGIGRNIKTVPSENNDTHQRNILPTNNTHSNKTHRNNTHSAKQSFAGVDGTVDINKVISFYKPIGIDTEHYKMATIDGEPAGEFLLQNAHMNRIVSAIERGEVDISDDQLDSIIANVITIRPNHFPLV